MKKQVLLTTGILISGIMAAQVSRMPNSKIPAHVANIAIKKEKTSPMEHLQNASSVQAKHTASVKKTSTYTSNVIGTTYYDLQTNSSVADRIVVNQDGSIAACWTFEPTAGDKTYPQRGTGYAYFNGSTWSAPPTVRVETSRVGWGNIANTRSGKELILAHNGGAAKLHLSSRPAKGTGSWTESTTTVPTATTGGNFWPRMVTAGDTVYAISLTYPSGSGGAVYQGVDGAVVFSRSLDQGVTWDIVNQIPTGLDATKYLGFGGDAYAIAAKGSTVVIVAGDSDKDVTLCKSTDAGQTWASTIVMDCPIDKWDHTTTTSDINADGIADTLEVNDGSFAIGLDNNNQAYVFFGRMRILQDAVQTSQTFSYFPGTDGLYMWKESFGAATYTVPTAIVVAGIQDLWQQGTIYFPTPAATGDLTFGRFGCSLTSHPSVAFDASNNVYLAYSSVVDSLMSFPNSAKLVRHTYVIKSTDGGTTWTNPCDIVGTPGGIPYEGVFGSMAKRVDGNVHIIYQRDLGCGNGIPGSASSPNPDENENVDNNDIVYFKFPVSEIGACAVDVGIKENKSLVSNLSFYPNPASTSGTIEVVLIENAKMEIVVMNAVGQTVTTKTVEGFAGSNKVDVNTSNLTSGLYFYQVKVANSKAVTQKFVVEK